MLTSDKADFRIRKIIRNKEEHKNMINKQNKEWALEYVNLKNRLGDQGIPG